MKLTRFGPVGRQRVNPKISSKVVYFTTSWSVLRNLTVVFRPPLGTLARIWTMIHYTRRKFGRVSVCDTWGFTGPWGHHRCWKFKYLIPKAKTLAKTTVNTTGMATAVPIMSFLNPNVFVTNSFTISGGPPPITLTRVSSSPNCVAIIPYSVHATGHAQ